MMLAAGNELPAPPPSASRCLHLLHLTIISTAISMYLQWSTLSQTSVIIYVNMVFDAISYYPMIYVMFV